MKYQYTGQRNKKCPVCSKGITGSSYPVIFFYKGSKLKEHMWCDICFSIVQLINHSTSSLFDQAIAQITEFAKKALGKSFPEDGILGGYWVAVDEGVQGQLILIIDIKDEYS
jgi:hypothetical protein